MIAILKRDLDNIKLLLYKLFFRYLVVKPTLLCERVIDLDQFNFLLSVSFCDVFFQIKSYS